MCDWKNLRYGESLLFSYNPSSNEQKKICTVYAVFKNYAVILLDGDFVFVNDDNSEFFEHIKKAEFR